MHSKPVGFHPLRFFNTDLRPLDTRYTEAARMQPSAKLARAVPATANAIVMDQIAAFLAPTSSMLHRITSVTANPNRVQNMFISIPSLSDKM